MSTTLRQAEHTATITGHSASCSCGWSHIGESRPEASRAAQSHLAEIVTATPERRIFGTKVSEADAAAHLVLVASNRETGSWDAACACGGWSGEGFGYGQAWDASAAHRESATGPAVVR